jgi:hypothetical protein
VAAGVLAEGDVAIDKRRFDGRKCNCAEIFLAEKRVDRASTGGAEEHAFGVDPTAFDLLRSTANENRTRRA